LANFNVGHIKGTKSFWFKGGLGKPGRNYSNKIF